MQRALFQDKNHEFKEPDFFIMSSKHSYPLLERKTLSLSSKVICYTIILEKTVLSKNVQKYKVPTMNCLDNEKEQK